MSKKLVLLVGAAATVVAGTLALASPREDNAIKARRGYYQMMLWDLDPAELMLKGDLEWDAEAAQRYALGMKELSDFGVDRLFVTGTSNVDKPGATRALPAIWENRSKFSELNAAWQAQARALLAASGQGQDAFNAELTKLGQTCKACHDDFRAKEF